MCDHKKTYKPIYGGTIEAIYCNPFYPWICETCLEQGRDYRWKTQGSNDYDALTRMKEDYKCQEVAEIKWHNRLNESQKAGVATIIF